MEYYKILAGERLDSSPYNWYLHHVKIDTWLEPLVLLTPKIP
jgi:hypothetical protein